MDNILDKIVREKVKEVEIIKKQRRSLKKSLAEKELTLIAEIKKASPSKGIIAENFNPERQLDKYINAGAGAVSILTDKKFFQGSKEIMMDLRKRTTLPLLRKDFIIDPIQVYESFFIGADIILLIAAILDGKELKELIDLTASLGMEALVEVHDSNDLDKAVPAGAEIIGVNNRDLKTFTIDLKNTAKIMDELRRQGIRDNYYIIAESGIKDTDDIRYLDELGINGVLIGETLMKSPDSEEKIQELFSNKLGVPHES
ncbi:MAG: indole-3-glycerol phosphate synthase TrpC [Halanaerobiales bacterium]